MVVLLGLQTGPILYQMHEFGMSIKSRRLVEQFGLHNRTVAALSGAILDAGDASTLSKILETPKRYRF